MARLAFLGSPPVAANTLRALVAAGHDVALVVSGPDKRRSRKAEPTPTAVKAYALSVGIPVTETIADVTEVGATLGIVVAFGRIIRPPVLEKLKMVNIHFSLLPRWRGAAPVERAILAGDAETGVCIMAVEEGLDTGGVYEIAATPINPNETAGELRDRLGVIGSDLLVKMLAHNDLPPITEQVGDPVYAEKISPNELEINFDAPAIVAQRQTRVGRAFTTFRDKRFIIVSATTEAADERTLPPGTIEAGRIATGDGWLVPDLVRPEGKGDQRFADWARGARLAEGERLGS